MKKTDSLFKQLHDANEKIKNLKLMNKCLMQDNQVFMQKIDDIYEIVDRTECNVMSDQYKIWKIINKTTDETK